MPLSAAWVRVSHALQLQQFLQSELRRLEELQERVDAAGAVQLDLQALDAQLAEHKVGPGAAPSCTAAAPCNAAPCAASPPPTTPQLLSADVLQHRSVLERLLAVAEPLLRRCPEALQQSMQVSAAPYLAAAPLQHPALHPRAHRPFCLSHL